MTPTEPLDPPRSLRLARLGGLVAIGVPAATLTLMLADGRSLLAMRPHAAFAFALSGIALLLLPLADRSRVRLAVQVLSTLVGAIALASLAAYFLTPAVDIDRWLAVGPATGAGMAPMTAFVFLLLTATMLLVAVRRHAGLVNLLNLAIAVVSMLGVIERLYDIERPYRPRRTGGDVARGVARLSRLLGGHLRPLAAVAAGLGDVAGESWRSRRAAPARRRPARAARARLGAAARRAGRLVRHRIRHGPVRAAHDPALLGDRLAQRDLTAGTDRAPASRGEPLPRYVRAGRGGHRASVAGRPLDPRQPQVLRHRRLHARGAADS